MFDTIRRVVVSVKLQLMGSIHANSSPGFKIEQVFFTPYTAAETR